MSDRFELLNMTLIRIAHPQQLSRGIHSPLVPLTGSNEHTAAICSTYSFRRIELETRTDDVRATLCICVLRLACLRNTLTSHRVTAVKQTTMLRGSSSGQRQAASTSALAKIDKKSWRASRDLTRGLNKCYKHNQVRSTVSSIWQACWPGCYPKPAELTAACLHILSCLLQVPAQATASLKQCVEDYEPRLEALLAELQALPVPTPADRDALQVTVIAQESLQQVFPSKSVLRQAPPAAICCCALHHDITPAAIFDRRPVKG